MKQQNNIEIKIFGAVLAVCIILGGCGKSKEDSYIQQISEIQNTECVEAAKEYVARSYEEGKTPNIVQTYAMSDMILVQTEDDGVNYMHKVYFSGKSPISDVRYELHD